MERVYSNYPTISKSIAEFWDKSKKDQEAVDETLAHIPRYMDRYMELNRLTCFNLNFLPPQFKFTFKNALRWVWVMLSEVSKHQREKQERKAWLRELFVQRARQYIGDP